jgi:hypothetical protein
VVSDETFARFSLDGGLFREPRPGTARPRPDARGSLVILEGVVVASMGDFRRSVWTAPLDATSVGDFTEFTDRSREERRDPRIVAHGRWVWLVGGDDKRDGDEARTPLIEVFTLDGRSPGPFAQTTPLPLASSEPAVSVTAKELTVCGGRGETGRLLETCAVAPIDFQTGQLGPFSPLPSLPYGMEGGALVRVADHLTLIGARSDSVDGNEERLFSLDVTTPGTWQRLERTLPAPRWLEDALILSP